MNRVIEIIKDLPPNRWLMGGGFVGVFFFGSTGFYDFTPNPKLSLAGIAICGIMIVLGAWYAREAKRFESMAKKPVVPVSDLSIEFAKTVDRPILAKEAGDLPPLKHDKDRKKEDLLKTVNRLRLREAAFDGRFVYYEDGKYVPHKEVTVFK